MRKQSIRKPADAGAGHLLVREGEGATRFLRGPHQGKLLSSLPKRDLTALLKRSYPHASDAELLLNEYLSREYGRPMTAVTAKAAMKAEWEEMKAKTQAKMDVIDRQPSLFDRLMAELAGKLSAAANNSEAAHEADNWPPPDTL